MENLLVYSKKSEYFYMPIQFTQKLSEVNTWLVDNEFGWSAGIDLRTGIFILLIWWSVLFEFFLIRFGRKTTIWVMQFKE